MRVKAKDTQGISLGEGEGERHIHTDDVHCADYVPTYPPIYLPTYLPTYLSIYLLTYLPNYLSSYLATYLLSDNITEKWHGLDINKLITLENTILAV